MGWKKEITKHDEHEHHRIAVIIPAYQAQATITKVLSGIPEWVSAVYVVDDASSDKTSDVIRGWSDSRVRLIRHEVNRGVGAAMVTGYQQALEDGVEICIKIDADDQMDPAYLPELLESILSGRADYAKGNRFHDFRALKQMPLMRKVGNALLSFLVKCASGHWHVFDPTNGYTAVHREALKAMRFSEISERYFFEISMLCLLGKHKAVVEDVPIPARYGNEISHLSIGKALIEFPPQIFMYGLKRILWQYVITDFNATSLFLLSGLLLSFFGVTFGSYHWIQSIMTGTLTPTGTIMVATLTTIIGFQLLLQAVATDIGNMPKKSLQQRQKSLSCYKEWLRAQCSAIDENRP